MAGHEGAALDSNKRSGKMVFEPILEDGVFRFDCSADDRNAAFPSFSFENPVVRDTPILNVPKIPTYIPTFECVMGQQVVNVEVLLFITISLFTMCGIGFFWAVGFLY